MPDLPSRLDLLGIGRDYVTTRAKRIDPAQVDVDGSDVNLFVGTASVLASACIKQLGYRTAALLVSGADGDDLDRLAFDRYGLSRKGASAATASVALSRPTAALGAGSVPIGTQLATSAGFEYVTTAAASFGASALFATPLTPVRATQAGKATQAGAHEIVRFLQPGSLFDSSLTVDNPQPAAGGEDAEDDDTFRNRVRDFWRTARRGILAAIEFGALTVSGVVSAKAIEALTVGGMPARVVNLFIADSSGVASAPLAAAVASALDDFRAAGIAVLVNTSLPQIVDVVLKLTFRAGVDTVSLSDLVRAAVVEFVNSLGVNETLFVSQLFSVLQRYAEDGLIVTQDSIQAPAGDVVPALAQTLRTTTANVTTSLG